MTAPAPTPTPPAQAAWPKVFDGIGALFVRCDNDPDVQAARIPGLTWCAVKVNDADASPVAERAKWIGRMRARGVTVGEWVYNTGPPELDASYFTPGVPFVIYDVEAPYKRDEEGGRFEWAAQLVAYHEQELGYPAAVTSYGGYKDSIDFAAFARAGWPILAQGYDAFTPADAASYLAVYPLDGIHQLVRSLRLARTQAVYRPESIDG